MCVCVCEREMKDNITKMGSEVSIGSVYRFFDLKIKIQEPNQTISVLVGSVRFKPNQTRSDIFSVWFGLNFRFHRFYPNHLHP